MNGSSGQSHSRANRIDPELFARFVSGEASAEEAERLERWACTPDRKRLISDARGSAFPEGQLGGERVWATITAGMASEGSVPTRSTLRATPARRLAGSLRPDRASSFRKRITLLGIGVAAASVVGVAMFSRIPHDNAKALRQVAYSTTVGQSATIRLPDDTRVTLAPQSTLSFESGSSGRSITLTGEALFDVVHAEGSPFVVRTGFVLTRVVGTRFDVMYDVVRRDARIAVLTGKVAVAPGRASAGTVVVTAGRVARVIDSTATVTAGGDMSQYMDWTRGRLLFDDATVADVLATVGRWYGYDFQLDDSVLAKRHLSAEFDKQSAAGVIAALEAVLNVDMTFQGTLVKLRPRTASPAKDRSRRESFDLMQTPKEVGR